MKLHLRRRWNLTPRQAMREQERLRERVLLEDQFGPIRFVAGADVAFDPATDLAFAGVIVYKFPELEEVERRMARRKLRFPYVPGLLSFRESPLLLAAFARLRSIGVVVDASHVVVKDVAKLRQLANDDRSAARGTLRTAR